MHKAHESVWALRADLLTAQALAWVASFGRGAELTSEAHFYFFDRYRRLAEWNRLRGRRAAARRLQAKADEHYEAGGGDGPPFAAAMGMPRPKRFIVTDAVSRTHVDPPDDAA